MKTAWEVIKEQPKLVVFTAFMFVVLIWAVTGKEADDQQYKMEIEQRIQSLEESIGNG